MEEKEITITPEIGEQDVNVQTENIIINAGGSNNYKDLINKPQINNVELTDNKTLDELGIQEKGDYALKSELPTKTSELTNDSDYTTNEYVNNLIGDINTVLSTLTTVGGDN